MFHGSTGKLQRQLRKGEFAMFRHSPMFESDFIQISKRGEVIDVHNSVQMVTLGIAYSSPNLVIPDVMLLARPAASCAVDGKHDQHTQGSGLKSAKSLELTRLLPLKFVKLSVYSHENKQLHLKLATGLSFYLQLCPASDAKDLFAHWEDLVFSLQPPVEAYSSTHAVPACDGMDLPVLEAEDRKSPMAMESHGEGDQDQVSIRSLPMVTEVSGATSLAYAGGEEVQEHASDKYSVPRVTLSFLTPAPAGPDQGAEPGAAAATPQGSVSEGAGGKVPSSPVTETMEGPGAEPFVSAWPSEDNVSEQTGAQKFSQCQAEALRKGKKKKKTPTKRPSHSSRKQEDRSISRSHGTTQGEQKDKDQSSLEGQGHGSSPQEYRSLNVTQKGSRLSQKSGGADSE